MKFVTNAYRWLASDNGHCVPARLILDHEDGRRSCPGYVIHRALAGHPGEPAQSARSSNPSSIGRCQRRGPAASPVADDELVEVVGPLQSRPVTRTPRSDCSGQFGHRDPRGSADLKPDGRFRDRRLGYFCSLSGFDDDAEPPAAGRDQDTDPTPTAFAFLLTACARVRSTSRTSRRPG